MVLRHHALNLPVIAPLRVVSDGGIWFPDEDGLGCSRQSFGMARRSGARSGIRLSSQLTWSLNRQDAKFAKVELLTKKPSFPWRPWRLGGEFIEVTCLATPAPGSGATKENGNHQKHEKARKTNGLRALIHSPPGLVNSSAQLSCF